VYEEVLKMLIGLEDAHAFHVSAFGGVEHLRAIKTIPGTKLVSGVKGIWGTAERE